ncbi:MAG TPA: RICIN domain-containing protein [Polyangia bacterium]|nr:RICIN domain-containing protein [Polyangia bacterium]
MNEAYIYSDSGCATVIDAEVTHTYTCQYPFGPFSVLYARVSTSPTGTEGCTASTPAASPSVPASNPLTVCCNPTDTFTLVNLASDKCLDVTGGSTQTGTKLQQLSCASGDDNQAWILTTSGGSLVLTAEVSGLCLAGSGAAAGTQVEEDTCDESAAQQWSLHYVGKLQDTDGKSYDYYELASPDSTLNAEVADASTADGAPVQTATPTGNANQRWKLVPLQ